MYQNNYNSGYGNQNYDYNYNGQSKPSSNFANPNGNFEYKNKPLPQHSNDFESIRSSRFMNDFQQSNFRNQFMLNSNVGGAGYSAVHSHKQADDDDFDFGGSSRPLVQKSPEYEDNYELHSINNHPPTNPFAHENDRGYISDQQFPYNQSPDPNSTKNPFDDANATYIPDKAQPPIPIVTEEDKLRHNEKERLRQLRSKPRFHYTRLPYFGMLVTIIQIIVFIVELVKMSSLTGSAFQTKPYFNPMLGPSTYLLINMGARYIPCMNAIEGITNDTSIAYPCANSTSTDTNVCNLSELCGLTGVPVVDDAFEPHQWYRIITPIFLHAGFLHILFNLMLQVTMGFSIERAIGPIKYAIIYLMSGIAGFLLGANFTPNGIASSGASGSLFGIVATNFILFIYCGKKNTNMYGTKKFGLFLFILVSEVVVSFVLGLLPGLDNFSHIGGFALGLLSSVVLLGDPFFVYQDGIITYQSGLSTFQEFANNWNPLYNFQDKLPSRFYMWCGVRILCLVFIVLYFALLAKNFFGRSILPQKNSCHWCKYISCLPVNGWCDLGTLEVETSDSDSSDDDSSSLTSKTASQTATSTQPDSIENTNVSNPNKRELEFASFLSPRINSFELIEGQDVNPVNIGLSFVAIMSILTITFALLRMKRKNKG